MSSDARTFAPIVCAPPLPSRHKARAHPRRHGDFTSQCHRLLPCTRSPTASATARRQIRSIAAFPHTDALNSKRHSNVSSWSGGTFLPRLDGTWSLSRVGTKKTLFSDVGNKTPCSCMIATVSAVPVSSRGGLKPRRASSQRNGRRSKCSVP